MIPTICSSVNLDFRIAPSTQEPVSHVCRGPKSREQVSEILAVKCRPTPSSTTDAATTRKRQQAFLQRINLRTAFHSYNISSICLYLAECFADLKSSASPVTHVHEQIQKPEEFL